MTFLVAACTPRGAPCLHACTACWADNPEECASYEEVAGNLAPSEETTRERAQVELCGQRGSHAKQVECFNYPASRFEFRCTER